jgi:two-component sensor histidine kinase
MKVIVVDDSAATRNFYRMLLEVGYCQAYSQCPSADTTKTDVTRNDRANDDGRIGIGLPTRIGNYCSYNTLSNTTKLFDGALEISEAATGAEGLRLCRELAPDCVLLDYKLRDMSGLEFLAQLCEGSQADSPAYAVVMLTGLASERVAVDALKAGAQDYLLKDRISAESLRLAVDKATGKVRLIRALKDERDRLAAMLAEKEVLLKEVHHRVKNNLQVIVSLLRLQTRGSQDGRLNEALLESQHRVESMALIHEQLYETTDLREVDLARHAALLIAKLFNSYGVGGSRIECRVNIEPLPLAVDQAIPAGLILNELISNALKHAFPGNRKGAVEVRGGRMGPDSFFEVSDDGVGVPLEIDLHRPRSLGLEIVKILARQLKGSITLERLFSPGVQGTTLRMCFPAPHAEAIQEVNHTQADRAELCGVTT